jgi:Ca2+-binding RTX toxin-like protein
MTSFIKNLFGITNQRSRQTPKPGVQLQLDALEERMVLAASFSSGLLTIRGDDGGVVRNDAITLVNNSNDPSLFKVMVNGRQQYQGRWADMTRGITIDGRKGNDTINIEHVAASVNVTVLGNQGNDIINISPVAQNLANIAGRVMVNGGAGLDTLNVIDRNNPLGGEFQLDATSIAPRGASNIYYGTVENLNVHTSNVRDRIRVDSTAFGTTTSIYANGGTDQIVLGEFDDLGLSSLAGPLNVDGGGDRDVLSVNDGNHKYDETYTITATTLTRSNWAASLRYTTVEDLQLTTPYAAEFGVSGSTVNVQGIAAGADLTVRTQPGTEFNPYRNTINVGNAANTLDDIRGRLVLLSSPRDVVNLHDEGTNEDQKYTLGYASGAVEVGREGTVIVSMRTFEPMDEQIMTLNAGSGNDRLRLLNVIPGLDVRYHAGSGIDTLDYSEYDPDYPSPERNRGVYVNLTDNQADGFAKGYVGGISGIENVFGTVKDDILIGDDNENSLLGNAGNDVLVGMAGSDVLFGGDGRDILIGGLDSDTLNGNDGEDIIIGGTTIYDNDVYALQSLSQNWSRNDMTYRDRVFFLNSDLLIFIPNLTTAKVKNDYARDLMMGGNDLDWFFSSDIANELNDRDYYNEYCMGVS